jgi:hypothetical protein
VIDVLAHAVGLRPLRQARRGESQQRDLPGDLLGPECRQSIILAVGRPIFDRVIAAFNETALAEAAAERLS